MKCAKKNRDDTSTVKIFNIYERNQYLLGMIKSQIPKGFKAEHYYKLKNTRQLYFMYNYRVLLLQQIYSNLNAKPFKLQSLGYFPTSNPHKFQLMYVKRY